MNAINQIENVIQNYIEIESPQEFVTACHTSFEDLVLQWQHNHQDVNRRAILSRLGVETASNSFHLSMSPSSVLAGGIWSVLHGYDL